MNQNIPPPHEGTPAQAAPNGDIMPATAPATRSNGRLILGTVVLLVLVGALGYGFWQHYSLHAEVIATADQRRDFVPSVRTAAIKASADVRSATWPGTTEAFEQANLYARASGYIAKRTVDIGSRVKAGDLLVEIAAPEIDHQIAQAEGTLTQLRATLQQAQANRDLAQVTWDRDSKLVQKGWFTEQQGDNDRLTLKARDAAVAVASANIVAQEAQLRVLNQQKTYLSVVAPFDGVITQRNIDVGSLVQADAASGTFLFQLMHSDVMRIQLYVPQDDAFGVTPGTAGRGAGAGNAGPRISRDGHPHRRRAAAGLANAADRDRRAEPRPCADARGVLHGRTEDSAQEPVADRALGGDHLQPRRPERRRGRGRRGAHPQDQPGAGSRHLGRGQRRREQGGPGDPQSAGRHDRRPQGRHSNPAAATIAAK